MSTTTTRRDFLRRLAGTAAGVGVLGDTRSILHATPTLSSIRHRATGAPDWDGVKALFPLRDDIVPMNAANLAPAPRAVLDAVISTVRDLEGDVSAQNRAKFGENMEMVRQRMAAFLGASPDEIAIVRNASEANNIIVGGVPLGAGDEVVVFDQNHQTNNVAWTVRAARYGFSVRTIAVDPNPESPEAVLDVFTRAMGPSTRVITFSDLSNVTGLRLPTREICHAARDRGIYVHVDGAQTLGATVRDLHDLGCDSYSASAHKWLMGPKEAGVLYVRSARAAEIWPGVVGVGWGNDVETSATGAAKFETLGQRNDATIAGLLPTLDLHDQIGNAVIAARIVELATMLKQGISEIPGAELVTPMSLGLSGGVVITAFPGKDRRAIYQALYRDHGIAGAATGGVRLCPHIYTTEEDVQRAIDGLARASA